MKSLFLLFLFSSSLGAQEWDLPKPEKILQERIRREDSLSPFPLYYTPLGAPKAYRQTIDGKEYAIIWDGERLEMRRLKPWYDLSGGRWLIPMGIFSLYFWVGLFSLLIHSRNPLIYMTQLLLVSYLGFSIYSVARRR